MAGDVFDRSLALFFIVLLCDAAGEKPTLFADSDDVVILDATNFNQFVHGSGLFWMVDFYNSWCGHCIHFAPVWKAFATDVKNWKSVVRIGAIDCSNDDNLVLCRNHAIQYYPTVMYFPPKTPDTYVGEIFRKRREVDVLRHSLLEYMLQGNSSHLPQLERLQPLKSLEHIWQPSNTDIKHVVVMFLSDSPILGQELVMDMLPYKEILLRYMMKKDVADYGIKVFPSLYLIEKGGRFVNLASNITEREQFLELLKQRFSLTASSSAPNNVIAQDTGHKDQSTTPPPYQQVPEAVYEEDLVSAVTYSLTHEVAAIKGIEGDNLQALKQYIQVLVKYLPVADNIINYLKKVDNWLSDAHTSIEGSLWLKTLNSIQDSASYIPFNTTYIGCHGSSSRFRGYPCSMWVLFHELTVNSVLQHGNEESFDPQEVLLAMRAYITSFFGCRECSVNFNKGARYIEERVRRPDDGILYLWIMHNRANYRLHGDITEDPSHPKIQFPGQDLCSECYVDDELKNGKPNWDEAKVLAFLKKFYSRENIHTKPGGKSEDNDSKKQTGDLSKKFIEEDDWSINLVRRREDSSRHLQDIQMESMDDDGGPAYHGEKFTKLRRHERDTRFSRKVVASTDLTGLDLSICVIFYIISTGFILGAYFYFAIRRKMKISACCNELV